MPDTNLGSPTTAQIIAYTDGLATIFKNNRAVFDQILTNTQTYRGVVASLNHANLIQQSQTAINAKIQQSRYENFFKQDFNVIQPLQNVITASLPSGWTLSGLLPLNGWLTRINGNSGISIPANPIVLTAATTVGGSLATVSAGNAPRVVFTHVGLNGSMYESLISAESTQVALVGSQNSYTVAITGTVPTTVGAMNIYRGLPGGIAGVYFLEQTVPLTPNAIYPTNIVIQKPDSFLLQTIIPPSFCSCLMTPEFAYEYALATATSSPVKSTDVAPYQDTATGMMSPANVALGPTNLWLGIGNQLQSGLFATKTLPAAIVLGAIQTTNVPGNNSQGFLGSFNGLQARATTILNGTYSSTISYTYLDATHSTPQTATGVTLTSNFAGSITNETKPYTITAGRVILSVTAEASGGTATTGAIVIEGVFPRSY